MEIVEKKVMSALQQEQGGDNVRKAISLLLFTAFIGLTLSQAFAQSTDQQKQKWGGGKQRDCVERGNCPK